MRSDREPKSAVQFFERTEFPLLPRRVLTFRGSLSALRSRQLGHAPSRRGVCPRDKSDQTVFFTFDLINRPRFFFSFGIAADFADQNDRRRLDISSLTSCWRPGRNADNGIPSMPMAVDCPIPTRVRGLLLRTFSVPLSADHVQQFPACESRRGINSECCISPERSLRGNWVRQARVFLRSTPAKRESYPAREFPRDEITRGSLLRQRS